MSATEQRYGIDIETFALATIRFTKETQDALEKERQTNARKDAAQARLRYARQVKKSQLSQSDIDAADVALDPSVKKTVTSVQGSAGVLGALAKLAVTDDNGGKSK